MFCLLLFVGWAALMTTSSYLSPFFRFVVTWCLRVSFVYQHIHRIELSCYLTGSSLSFSASLFFASCLGSLRTTHLSLSLVFTRSFALFDMIVPYFIKKEKQTNTHVYHSVFTLILLSPLCTPCLSS